MDHSNEQLEIRVKNLEKALVTLLDSFNKVTIQSASMGIDDNMHYSEDTIMVSNLSQSDLNELIARLYHRDN